MSMSPTGQFTWANPTMGTRTITLRVKDDAGDFVDQTFDLEVYDETVNRPPVFTTKPQRVALLGQDYDSLIEASDPEDDFLSYSLLSGPNGLQLTTDLNGQHHLTWNASSIVAGKHPVVVTVSDGHFTIRQTFTLHARTNAAPEIEPIDAFTITAGQPFRFGVRATDGDGDALQYSVGSSQPGDVVSVDDFGRISWLSGPGHVGTHTFTVTATDGLGGVAAEDFQVTVVADTQAPSVTLTANRDPVPVSGTVTLTVAATDNVEIHKFGLELVRIITAPDGTVSTLHQAVTLNAAGRATLTVDQLGSYEFLATAKAPSLNVGSTTLTVSVVSSIRPPKVSLKTPTEGQVITEPTSLVGTVDDLEDDLAAFVLTASPVGGGPEVQLATGTVEVLNQSLG